VSRMWPVLLPAHPDSCPLRKSPPNRGNFATFAPI
jgi:hypothetical protein